MTSNTLSPGYYFAMAGDYPDPSQWTNPYSSFSGQALPTTDYVGAPTDALGRSIQGYQTPGTTVNSVPQSATPIDTSNMFGGTVANMMRQSTNDSPQQKIYTVANSLPGGNTPANAAYAAQLLGGYGSQNQATSAASSAASSPASTGYGSSNYQAALSALANPNYVHTPGANVPSVLANTGGMPNPYQSIFNMRGGGMQGGMGTSGFQGMGGTSQIPQIPGIGGGSSMPFMSGGSMPQMGGGR